MLLGPLRFGPNAKCIVYGGNVADFLRWVRMIGQPAIQRRPRCSIGHLKCFHQEVCFLVSEDSATALLTKLRRIAIYFQKIVLDRKSVMQGKSLFVSVDLGGSRSIKKKKTQ